MVYNYFSHVSLASAIRPQVKGLSFLRISDSDSVFHLAIGSKCLTDGGNIVLLATFRTLISEFSI